MPIYCISSKIKGLICLNEKVSHIFTMFNKIIMAIFDLIIQVNKISPQIINQFRIIFMLFNMYYEQQSSLMCLGIMLIYLNKSVNIIKCYIMEVKNDQSDHFVSQQTVQHQISQRQQPKQDRYCKLFMMLLLISIVVMLGCALKSQTKNNCQKQQSSVNTTTNQKIIKKQMPLINIHIGQKPFIDNQSIQGNKSVIPHIQFNLTQLILNQSNQQFHKSIDANSNIKNSNFSLWQISKEQKIKLLAQINPENSSQELDYTPFLRDKDEETKQFFAEYESRSQLINWQNIELDQKGINSLTGSISLKYNELNKQYDEEINKQYLKFQDKEGYMGEYNKGITYEQFFKTLNLKKLLMAQAFKSNSLQIQSLQAQQRILYQHKYRISQYQQLPVCIVMPTYNNQKDYSYVWSIESILQQQYSNLKVIIIDDNSKDKTAQRTATYLKWRNADPSKYILISSKQHRGALQNIYYGAHKYCDYNQIFFIIDGDDQLFGRQVFKVFNALYQQQKMYALYTQFISYNPKLRKEKQLDIGISQDFPNFVKERNSYRTFKHSYSQLRSVLSDLILLERKSSLKLKNGKFFAILYDNALFYPAFEMACKKIQYLPQIFYWYNINTGSNDWRLAKTPFYKQNRFGIQLQRPYRCIDDQLVKAVQSNK